MEKNKLLSFASKLKNKYKNVESSTELYNLLKGNDLINEILGENILTPEDFIYLIFMIFLLNKGNEPNSVLRFISNSLFGFKIYYIVESEPEVECDECHGSGEQSCDECDGGLVTCRNCGGDKEVECSECDGDGRVDCGTCNGSGESEDGSECPDCDSTGLEQCSRCNGTGNVRCDYCWGQGDNTCDNCGGSSKVGCEHCDGRGTKTINDSHEVEIFYFLSVNSKIMDKLLYLEDDSKISDNFLTQLKNDKLTILCYISGQITDVYYYDNMYNEGDIIFSEMMETPKIKMSASNLFFS